MYLNSNYQFFFPFNFDSPEIWGEMSPFFPLSLCHGASNVKRLPVSPIWSLSP